MYLFHYAKNEAVLSICSGEIIDLKILKSHFELYIRSKIFSKYGFEQEHNKRYKFSLWKIFEIFEPFILIFWTKIAFTVKIDLSSTNWFLAPSQNSEKPYDLIQRKHPDK